ncbi:MAG: hypothetical protein ABUS47_05280 [Steroidobacter sp.]
MIVTLNAVFGEYSSVWIVFSFYIGCCKSNLVLPPNLTLILHASLAIRTFPDGNHNLQQADTGGLREMMQMKEHRACPGYHMAMTAWLRKNVLE